MRLIDADKLEVISYKDTECQEDTFDEGVRWMAELIDKQPTVDAVPATRCKDCKDFRRNNENDPYCTNRRGLDDPVPDGFCNYGKPKEECENGRND